MKNPLFRNLRRLCAAGLAAALVAICSVYVKAIDFPAFNVNFEDSDQSVIVDNVPAESSDGSVKYQLEGYLNYGNERIETFCYAPNVISYDIAEAKGYIFNWSGEKEAFLPCSGTYQFTAYITAHYQDAQGKMIEEKGPKTTISITLTKKDESTNWGPGLPNTTVESYDLNQIKGKEKTVKIKEDTYTWTIKGTDIVSVPKENLSLKITENPSVFDNTGVDAFFGTTAALKFNIEHHGEFGFKATLAYKVGAEYAGKYANLFYVAGSGVFEFIDGSPVDENGTASFALTHASDYIVAITDTEYTGQPLNDAISAPSTQETVSDFIGFEPKEYDGNASAISSEEAPAVPKSGSGIWYVGGGLVVIAASTAGIVLAKKKK